ncbi:MAG: hypothetical protein FWC73_00950 [Defluviitaleaceae bacterium]|nr:hypothetical protein [Defluviitaleaceae bacterium]
MKKIRKIVIAMLLTIAMLVPMAVPVMANPTWDDFFELQGIIDDLRRQNQELRDQLQDLQTGQRVPLVHVVTPQNIVVEPGDDEEVSVTIRNIGSHSAHNFLSTATVSADAPFMVEFLNNTNRLSTLSQNSQRNMIMRIVVDANAEPGDTGTITLTHRFNTHLGAPTDSTDTIHVRIGGDAGATGLRLTNIRSSETNLGQNQEFNVTATLENTGTAPANNVQISLANLDTESIILTSDLGDAAFSALEPGQSRQVSFTFRTARDISSGFYAIYFRLIYDRVAENRPLVPFYVTVVADYATTSPHLELRNISAPTARLNVGQTGNITFELANTGDAIAHNIRVSATPLGEGAAPLVPTTSNVQSVQSLGVDAYRAFTFGFMPTNRAETQSYAIQLRVEYEIRGTGGEPSPFVQYVGLNVFNPEPEEDDDDDEPGRRQIPRIIVYTNSTYPQIPRAGQNFDMEITFLNTSNTRAVNNIRITLDAPPPATGGQQGSTTGGDSVFVPVGGSNTLFVSNLAPGESVTRTITMFTVPDASPRIYTMQVNLDYQDEEFDHHEVTELISVPVAQDSRLETRPPEVAIMPFMDMFGFVDFEFDIINSGRVNLRNLRVRVDGNFDTSQANDYLGNLQQGRVVNFRGRIFPSEPGLQEGAIVVYAEDDAGEIVEIVHPFTIDVMGGGMGDEFMMGDDEFMFGDDEMFFEGGGDRFDRFPGGPMDEMGMDMYGEEEGGIFSRIWAFMRRSVFWGPAAGVIVAAGVAVVVIWNKKRSKLDFDD